MAKPKRRIPREDYTSPRLIPGTNTAALEHESACERQRFTMIGYTPFAIEYACRTDRNDVLIGNYGIHV